MRSFFNHPFHIVENSPWPIITSFIALRLTIRLGSWFNNQSSWLFLILRLVYLILVSFTWWRDVSRERTNQGLHRKMVSNGLKAGIILFITSEVFFFVSFFWAFFHSRLSPNIELGSQWPPLGVQPFNPWEVPLLNTIILVSSGVRVTWCHKAIEVNLFSQAKISLILTVLLGIYFTLFQAIEYIEASFTIADSVYGSTFFIATGFHGLHVIVGTLFLVVCLIRFIKGILSKTIHIGLLRAIWYWHFVDVVWLFLFAWIYIWGAY